MNPDSTWVLDIPLGDTGFTTRHAVVGVCLLLMLVTVISTLWNGRRSRLTCGAPRRKEGRCRRPMRNDGTGCGIHTGAWIPRDIILGILIGVGGGLLFWNFEDAVTWVGTTVSDLTA